MSELDLDLQRPRVSPDWCHVTEQRLDELEAEILRLAGQVDGLRTYMRDIEFNLRRDLGRQIADADDRLRKRVSRASVKLRTEIAAANKLRARRKS